MQQLQIYLVSFCILKNNITIGTGALLLVGSDLKKQKQHLARENGKWALCTMCNKEIHAAMSAVMLLHAKLVKTFAGQNPHNSYAQNKDIDKQQLTVAFHTNDALVAHLYSSAVTEFMKKLDSSYRRKDPFRMTLDFKVMKD